MVRIYTRTGDAGMTGLYDGGRVAKTDARFDALGTLDELNSWLGTAREDTGATPGILGVDRDILEELQCRLLDIGSALAVETPAAGVEPNRRVRRAGLDRQQFGRVIGQLESRIDAISDGLPPLTKFILPAGILHQARAVSRRAERDVLRAGAAKMDPAICSLLNRLSDYLFTLARASRAATPLPDTEYQKTRAT